MKFVKNKKNKGFSIVELVVTVAIFGIITSVILANNAKFNSATHLNNLIYEIALTVRQAQVFGISVRETEAGAGEFGVGYGVYFDTSNDNSFVLFADLNGNEQYDGTNELVDLLTIKGENRISQICVTDASETRTCGTNNARLNGGKSSTGG